MFARTRSETKPGVMRGPYCEAFRTLCDPSQTSRPRTQREAYHKNRPHSGTSWFRESRGPERSGCSRQQHTSVCCSRIWTQSVRPHGSGTLSKWRGKEKQNDSFFFYDFKIIISEMIKLVSIFCLQDGWGDCSRSFTPDNVVFWHFYGVWCLSQCSHSLTKWRWSCQVWGAGVGVVRTTPVDSRVDVQHPGGLTAQDHLPSLTHHQSFVFSWLQEGAKKTKR